MHTLQKIGAVAAAVLLPLFLFGFGVTFGMYQVFGSADNIQNALNERGAYQSLADNFIDTIEQEGDSGNDLPIDDPKIRGIIEETLSGSFLRDNVDTFLDSAYAWIKGDTETIVFTIDLKDVKTELVTNIASYATTRAKSLPTCQSIEEIIALRGADTEAILNARCVPPNFDYQALTKQVRQELNQGEFLEDTQLTTSDFTNDQGKTLEEQLQPIRDGYNKLVTSMYVTGVGSVLLLAAVVLLSETRRKGIRRGALSLLAVGVLSVFLGWIMAFMIDRLGAGFAGEEALVQTLFSVVSQLMTDLRNYLLIYGIVLSLIGAGALVTLHFVRPPKPTTPPENIGKKDVSVSKS